MTQTATAFVDFAKLKETVSIAQVVQMLGLQMKTQGDQMRGECLACKAGGPRALAVNVAKSGYYCFSEKKGGDAIALASHITGKSAREAAQQIATFFRFAGSSDAPASQPPAPKVRQGFDAKSYLRALDPAAAELKDIGLTPDCLKEWRAGYCKTGVNRGKLAIAVCDRDGNILGFAGRSLDSNQLTFPNGLNPADVVFGQDKIGEGEVRLLREPLEVMQASEVGEPAVCLLTDTIEPQQLEQLAALLDIKKAKLIL
jgi:hypothetical protein